MLKGKLERDKTNDKRFVITSQAGKYSGELNLASPLISERLAQLPSVDVEFEIDGSQLAKTVKGEPVVALAEPLPQARIEEVKLGVEDEVFFSLGMFSGRSPKWYARIKAPSTALQITDRSLGLREGTGVRLPPPGVNPGIMAVEFSSKAGHEVPVLAGQAPSIDKNPYNFVALAGDRPWLDPASGSHTGHDKPAPHHLDGVIDVSLTALSPCFVPDAAHWNSLIGQDSDMPRQFSRMLHPSGEIRLAIPGAGLKGAIRSLVEAIANDRFGVLDKGYEKAIPYRRRAFGFGKVVGQGDKWHVVPYETLPDFHPGGVTPEKFYLLASRPGPGANPNPPAYKPTLRAPIEIPQEVWEAYEQNLKNPHFERHFNHFKPDSEDLPTSKLPIYGADLGKDIEQVRKDLKLKPNDFIYYIAENGRVVSFGKNVNYLWPSLHSVESLIMEFKNPPQRSTKTPLGIAERLFGFSSDHGDNSHPFRGKVRVETAWGSLPDSVNYVKCRLGPQTSPETRAKSRPLYLSPADNGRSASYSDQDQTKLAKDSKLRPAGYAGRNPKWRGRKFYWKQRFQDGAALWPLHEFHDLHAKVEKQCPPRLQAVPKGSEFKFRLHFNNLSNYELGCLLTALEGLDECGPGYVHALHLGKGKPRGLGAFKTHVEIELWQLQKLYASLGNPGAPVPMSPEQRKLCKQAFLKWCWCQANRKAPPKEDVSGLDTLPHLRDFSALQRWPDADSVRHYPLNFSQYGWLPCEDAEPDEPKGQNRQPNKHLRPPAMQLARDEWRKMVLRAKSS